MQFRPMVGGIGRVRRPDTLLQFLALYGTSLYILLTLLLGLTWAVGRRVPLPGWRRASRASAIGLPLLALALLLGGWAFGGYRSGGAQGEAAGAGFPVLTVVLAVLVALTLVLALVARLRDEEWMVLWLTATGL